MPPRRATTRSIPTPASRSTARLILRCPIPARSISQVVIAEWQVSETNPNVIDPATRREVMRIDEPQFNHKGGKLAFRATDHYLYLSLGDGGNANDVGDGHTR